jgi:hypothetical protein
MDTEKFIAEHLPKLLNGILYDLDADPKWMADIFVDMCGTIDGLNVQQAYCTAFVRFEDNTPIMRVDFGRRAAKFNELNEDMEADIFIMVAHIVYAAIEEYEVINGNK